MEGKNDDNLTSVKSRPEKDESSSDFQLVISPRKSTRMKKSMKRKEEVQIALQTLISDRRKTYEKYETSDQNTVGTRTVEDKSVDIKSVNDENTIQAENKKSSPTGKNTDDNSENKDTYLSPNHFRNDKAKESNMKNNLVKSLNDNQEFKTPNTKNSGNKTAPGMTSKPVDDKTEASNLSENQKTVEPLESTPKSSRKRKKIDFVAFSDVGDALSDDNNITPAKLVSEILSKSSTGKRRGRPPKKQSTDTSNLSQSGSHTEFQRNEANEPDSVSKGEHLEHSEVTPRSYRKRKKIDYAALNDVGSQAEDDKDNSISSVTPNKIVSEDLNKSTSSKCKKRGRPSKKHLNDKFNVSQTESEVVLKNVKTKRGDGFEKEVDKLSEDNSDPSTIRNKLDDSAFSDIDGKFETVDSLSSVTPDKENNKDVSKNHTPSSQSSSCKRRGRPSKRKPVDGLTSSENERSSGLFQECMYGDGLDNETPEKSVSETHSKSDGQSNISSKSKRRGRVSKKHVNDVSEDKNVSEDTKDELRNQNVVEAAGITPRSARRKKKIDYAAFDNVGDEEDGASPTAKGRNKSDEKDNFSEGEDFESEEEPPKRKKSKSATSKELEVDNKTPKGERTKSKRQKKTPETPETRLNLKCSRCEENFNTKLQIKHHMAVKHQALWTAENPEGLDDYRSLGQVIKIKKHLNCPKCGKQINFHQYYKQHTEWCGRDDEFFQCPICGSDKLLLKWQHLHLASCRKILKQREEAMKRAEALKQQKTEDDELTKSGKKRKRRAAKVASTMLHNLSKDKDVNLGEDYDDDMVDRDFKAEEEDVEEVEEEYEEDDNEDEEDEGESGSDVNDVDDIVVDKSAYGWNKNNESRRGKFRHMPKREIPYFYKYHVTYSQMEGLVKKHLSKDVYLDLLPNKHDWNPLEISESEMYLPTQCQSINFTFSDKEADARNLNLYESVSVRDFPVFFTGLSIWKMAWCPTPAKQSAIQYLAIAGKVDHESPMKSKQRVAAPGIIQIWDMGVKSNSLKAESLPKLAFNIAHDYGSVTELKWCPSGCWQRARPETDGTLQDVSRLGLLACSFTDSTVRIFSIPQGLQGPNESVPTYKPSPSVTLVPHRLWNSCSITCACLDWQSMHGHSKIISGYSDGSVRIFNLMTKSSLQVLETLPHKVLLPCQSFQAHYDLVRSCSWMCSSEDEVVTCGDDSSTCFWDLKNTSQPLNLENTSFMPLRTCSCLLYQGVFTTSDDSYSLNTNKARYLEPANLRFSVETKERRTTLVNYTTSQSACIWDISYSNWLNFMISCDSRGTVVGVPIFDLLCHPDLKNFYKQRLLLHQTKVKWKTLDESGDSNILECTCTKSQPESCKKCRSHSGKDINSKSEHLLESESDIGQSDKVLHSDSSDSQSKDLLQKKSERTSDQSENLIEANCDKQNNSLEKVCDLKNSEVLPKKTISDITIQSEKHEDDSQLRDPETYSGMVKKKYLEFTERLKEKSRVNAPTMDQEFDTYDRCFINALTTISFNPNKSCCCWVAFGGEAGLVRLVNIWQVLPGKFLDYYKFSDK